MKIRRKIRPPKCHHAKCHSTVPELAEYDFKYVKIVVDTRGALNKFHGEEKPDSAGDSSWCQGDLVDKYATPICMAVDEFDEFRVHNSIGCISDPFNREELWKSEQAEAVRRLVSNAYLELNERSFFVLDLTVSLMRGVRGDRCVPVSDGFIFYNWMPSSWIPSSTEFLEYPGLRSLYKTNSILTKKKGRHSRGRCGYQGRKPR